LGDAQKAEQFIQGNEFLAIQDLSVHLKIKVKTLYCLVEENRIPHYRVGKLIRFKRSEIDAWMEGNKKGCVASEQVAMKALGPVRKPKIDIDRIVRKAIDGTRGQGYTTSHGKTRPQGPQEGGQ
jgi:excisionase family DNA binding protein